GGPGVGRGAPRRTAAWLRTGLAPGFPVRSRPREGALTTSGRREQRMNTATKNLVIVGGGFAGVYAARYLRRQLPAGWLVTLFSQENHFIFTPLLGDVVGSSINPMHVVWPVRQMARGAVCRTAPLTGIDLQARQVHYRTLDGRDAQQPY